jgi:hypothetical protein
MIERLCQHYHCRPSELDDEDGGAIFQRFELLNIGGWGEDNNGE